jgi:hypothetical protein
VTHTYRATVAVPIEIASDAPLTEGELRSWAATSVRVGLQFRIREEPSVSIDDAWCTAVNRRNAVDGRLYACQMAAAHPIHGSVERCGAVDGVPCERPADHHEFVSPGFEDPADARVELFAGSATFDAPAGAGYGVQAERG